MAETGAQLTATVCTGTIIPAMTSATAPSGVVSASGALDANRAAWMAFDRTNPAGSATGTWTTAGTTGWLQYQFPAAHVITSYAVTSRNYASPRAPKTWTFKGSNNGTTWTTLDTQTNITDWAATANVRKVFDCANTTAYAYYRLDITASNDADYVGVGELEMMKYSGLHVIADGADTANPAESLNAVTYTIGDRVQVTLRTPRMPLVTGTVTTA